MTGRLVIPALFASALLMGCAARPERPTQGTLAELRRMPADMQEADVDQGLEQAMESYRRFLEEAPETEMTPEAMRRLADLEIEKQFGLRAGDGKPREMAAPEPVQVQTADQLQIADLSMMAVPAGPWESDQEFEDRATAANGLLGDSASAEFSSVTEAGTQAPKGPLEAIALYDRLLTEYPNYENNDKVLYQMARAYDELGRTEDAIETMDRMMRDNPHSEHYDEVQFRRGEYFFTRRKYRDAESAYSAILTLGRGSSYYELALYKLGWTLYKQELYEEALHQYMALLDYKISIGYDFDQTHAEDDERRVADTYRVISLSLNNLGGPEAVNEYFSAFGNRSYEDRVYANLGEYYLAKLRYDDAAKTYRAFVSLYPFHRSAPKFSIHVVETFTQGGFPKLVLEAKRDFADRYGLQADYWHHFRPEESPEVIAYLKSNLNDLATHYHARYQGTEDSGEKLEAYGEALRWYGDYLKSFPTDADTPPINYRLADLLLENEDFGQAALQYESTAYGYPNHPQSAAAGYAAVFAYREQLKRADEHAQDAVRRDTVASSLRFADAFPGHESAAAVLAAAADDLYEMQVYPEAVASAQRVIDSYPDAETGLRRSAWIVVAHGSFELAQYPRAEQAYTQILSLTPRDDESAPGFVDNLAAAIYKQGEIAKQAGDLGTAAEHFLRIRNAAPTSAIRPTAEYDAGVALVELEDWTAAANVLEGFRSTFPEHEMHLEATRLIARAYRESGQLSRAAREYDRIASETEDPAMRSEALLVAGELYQETDDQEQALAAYRRYVDEFPEPIEMALETRLKIAEIYNATHDLPSYHQELADIISIEAVAGEARTGRTRTIAGRSALVLAENLYRSFTEVRLLQPFETSLLEKKQRMDAAIEAMEVLVDYGIADVTAAATYYMAETYLDFSRALADSERPSDLQPAELAEYEMALEEEAFPFEERSIDLHEKNLEMLHAGILNPWVEKSLGKLTELMPARYARSEMSSGFLVAIDRYVYRSPAAQVYGPMLTGDGWSSEDDSLRTSHLEPGALDE